MEGGQWAECAPAGLMLMRAWALLQGTFLVRPSLSLAGAMVLSVVVEGAVKHMALDGNQLDTRSLEVGLPAAPVALPAQYLTAPVSLCACMSALAQQHG